VAVEPFYGLDPELKELGEFRMCFLVPEQVESPSCIACPVFGGCTESEDRESPRAFEESHERTVPRRTSRR
jgi:hypothetical protein